MRAVVVEKLGSPEEALSLREVPDPVLKPGEALVRVRAAALNHRDTFILQKLYPKIQLPAILGSDGAGEVVRVADGVDPSLVGRKVVIAPSHDWGRDPRAPGKAFLILGMPDQGTMAELIARPAGELVPMPEHLSFQEAAALPLGGLTAYRALVTRGQIKASEHVLVTGIGGGVATLAMLIAQALGAKVSVTSGSEDKLRRARELGAVAAVSYKDPDWGKKLVEQAGSAPSLIIDSVGGENLNALINVAEPGARIVIYGATAGLTQGLNLHRVFFKQLDLRGTTMGTDAELRELLQVVAQKKLRPLVDQVFPLDQAAAAVRRMDEGKQMGKIVLAIP
jgi:NADPH:quinone reductase-like Zn-dependent oxidoreductase